jgi:hypothetical protein
MNPDSPGDLVAKISFNWILLSRTSNLKLLSLRTRFSAGISDHTSHFESV